MSEQLHNDGLNVERIALQELSVGDQLDITTGHDDQRWTYMFSVTETGHWPTGMLSAINPNGMFIDPMVMVLHGAGNWTSRRQNPVQKQDRAFTSYFSAVYTGGNIIGAIPGECDRIIFDAPDQQITNITVHRQ